MREYVRGKKEKYCGAFKRTGSLGFKGLKGLFLFVHSVGYTVLRIKLRIRRNPSDQNIENSVPFESQRELSNNKIPLL